jgi:hypothetical protein
MPDTARRRVARASRLFSGGIWPPRFGAPPAKNRPTIHGPPLAFSHPHGGGASRLLSACYQAEPGVLNSMLLPPENGH